MPSSLLALLDDIASLLDDVAALTKVAGEKTAGVLGDDLALNAKQVAGVAADRELPVVWAVAKGSLVNKSILVPAALAISAIAPWAVTPLLVLGGAYLCFEGVEKVVHVLGHHRAAAAAAEPPAAPADGAPVDLAALERARVRGAIRTDFILSAEIIVITLGTVAGASFVRQVGVLVAISIVMTVGVYGLVAGIVKLDDAGFALLRRRSSAARALGRTILALAPWLMRALSVGGTAAMFLVGGGILTHAVPWLHHGKELAEGLAPGFAGTVLGLLFDAAVGIALGLLVLFALAAVRRMRPRRNAVAGS
jgi:hypothetical protein